MKVLEADQNAKVPGPARVKNIAIIGSTGSIGENTLQIVRTHPGRFKVCALAAKKNAEKIFQQALEFRPDVVCLYETTEAKALEARLRKEGIRLVTGDEGLVELSRLDAADQIIFALVGAIGLKPIFASLAAGKAVAVANKEPLVVAGSLLMAEARRRGVSVCPIDSEHSGLWQCLEGRDLSTIKKLLITSSGGPFRTREGSLDHVTPAEALNHPKWKMGPKITIDSATLMNKGLEVIEAVNLFGLEPARVEVLVHPEAIVHAMVEFVDGSYLAHMGITDMRLPIQYALSYPERLVNHLPELNLWEIGALHFEKPDMKKFPCLELGYEASRAGGTMPAVLNAANEIAVEAFLTGRIPFPAIASVIEKTMGRHDAIAAPALDDFLEADRWAREEAARLIKETGRK